MVSRIRVRRVAVTVMIVGLVQIACGSGTGNAPQPPAATVATAQPTSQALAEHGTVDEANAMLARAIADYDQAGRDRALKDFNDGQAPFLDRDLYVVCIGADHLETANGGFPQYVGASADLLTDSEGKPLGKTVWDAASPTTVNSVRYNWTDPVTGQTEPKTLYFQKVGTDVCGVGVYSP